MRGMGIVLVIAVTLAGCAGKRTGGMSDTEGAAISNYLRQQEGAKP